MKVLVTGGAGFIASHLVEELLARGDHVTVIDNLFTGSRSNLHRGADFIRHDVCEPFHVECDQIYHLACPASPEHYQRNPVRTIQTAVLGTMHALQLARDTGARLLLTSTSEVYGDPDVSPQPEAYNGNVSCTGPRACYDEGKRCGEALAASWRQQYGTDVRIARLFNTYGPRMASGDGRLIPNFITQALRGEPLTVYGDGQQTRSFCFVSDTVRGLMMLMNTVSPPPVVNIGNDDERMILAVAQDVNILTRNAAGIAHRPLPTDDPRQRRPSLALARGLGIEALVPFTEGLSTTVEWFRGQR